MSIRRASTLATQAGPMTQLTLADRLGLPRRPISRLASALPFRWAHHREAPTLERPARANELTEINNATAFT